MTACDFGASREECGCRDCREVLELMSEPKTEIELKNDEISQLQAKLVEQQKQHVKQEQRIKYLEELIDKNAFTSIVDNDQDMSVQLQNAVILKITPINKTKHKVHFYKVNL